jgi:hypothetical protein
VVYERAVVLLLLVLLLLLLLLLLLVSTVSVALAPLLLWHWQDDPPDALLVWRAHVQQEDQHLR